jgi:hypothetical protein
LAAACAARAGQSAHRILKRLMSEEQTADGKLVE